MTNKEKTDSLLSNIRDLELLITEQREGKAFSATFFDETFELSQKIQRGLHSLANEHLCRLDRRIEELSTFPVSALSTQTVIEEPDTEPERQHICDIRKALSLNDRFRFLRELFGGDEKQMVEVINKLNEFSSYDDSIGYITRELQWNTEEEAAADFIKLLEKRFL